MHQTPPHGWSGISQFHKTQTPKRACISSGGACHGRAGCQRGGSVTSGGASRTKKSPETGCANATPATIAISGNSNSESSSQKHGANAAESSQQQHPPASPQETESPDRNPAAPATQRARKQMVIANNFFTAIQINTPRQKHKADSSGPEGTSPRRFTKSCTMALYGCVHRRPSAVKISQPAATPNPRKSNHESHERHERHENPRNQKDQLKTLPKKPSESSSQLSATPRFASPPNLLSPQCPRC